MNSNLASSTSFVPEAGSPIGPVLIIILRVVPSGASESLLKCTVRSTSWNAAAVPPFSLLRVSIPVLEL